MNKCKPLRAGTRVRVKTVRENVTDEVKGYVGKTGHIKWGGSPADDGTPGYHIRFDDGSLGKRFYQDELEVVK